MNQNTYFSSHTHFSRIREMNQNTHSPSNTYFSFIREIKQNTHCPSHTHFSAHTHFSRIREMNQNTHFSSNTYFFFIREMNQNTRYYHSNTDFSFKYAFLLTYALLLHSSSYDKYTFLFGTRNKSQYAFARTYAFLVKYALLFLEVCSTRLSSNTHFSFMKYAVRISSSSDKCAFLLGKRHDARLTPQHQDLCPLI